MKTFFQVKKKNIFSVDKIQTNIIENYFFINIQILVGGQNQLGIIKEYKASENRVIFSRRQMMKCGFGCYPELSDPENIAYPIY